MEIPQAARYGIWNQDSEEWSGEWFYSDGAAADAESDLRRAGGVPFVVVGVNGIDDSWLEDLQD